MNIDTQSHKHFDFLIVGGGIAGVVCAETLCELIRPSKFGGAGNSPARKESETTRRVALISATSTVKTTINLRRITNLIEAFDVSEQSGDTWSQTWPGTLFLFRDVEKLDPENHLAYLKSRGQANPLSYGRLCLTTGGVPRLIDDKHPRVVALRDTESLATFQARLRDTRRLLLVGNGGIATEIAHEVTGCQLLWAIKDASISTPFLDPSAARFLLEARSRASAAHQSVSGGPSQTGDEQGPAQIRRMRYVVASDEVQSSASSMDSDAESRLVLVPDNKQSSAPSKPVGAALGPDWAFGTSLQGSMPTSSDTRSLKVVYKVRVLRLLTPDQFKDSGLKDIDPFPEMESPSDWPVFVELTNGEVYGCDLIVSAVGIEASFQPNRSSLNRTTSSDFFGTPFDLAPPTSGGGLLVDDQMQTSVPDVYAAGDCAFANWTWAPHWIQMRLWSQARQMGFQAAKCMFGHSEGEKEVPLDFSFELFTHVTYFFGFKVVLLGLFNGQGLDLTSPDCYLLMRVTPGEEYVKCVMRAGRMQGALLIGETDLEETLENLIVNQLDLTNLEDSLLDPNVDLSDYFD